MPDSQKAVLAAARKGSRALKAKSRPSKDFDASRYFRGADDLGFYNVGAATVRSMAKAIVDEHPEWTIDDAMALAECLMPDRHLEAKSLAVEVVARYRRQFSRRLLPSWKRWLSSNWSANWATTDGICGYLIGPLLVAEPTLANELAGWSNDQNLWVRRAAVVGLIPLARLGKRLNTAYGLATRLHGDREDLIQKAVGWMLREAGKADPVRLERYLGSHGPRIPRTTLRYAIERFSPRKRKVLLGQTRR